MVLRTLVCSMLLVSSAFVSGCKSKELSFQHVNPATGRMSGGQEVHILGTGFQHLGSLEIRIDGRPAQNVGVMGEDTIVLTTPEGREGAAAHPVDISILSADGKSIVLRGAWTYEAGGAPGSGGGGAAGPNEDLQRRL